MAACKCKERKKLKGFMSYNEESPDWVCLEYYQHTSYEAGGIHRRRSSTCEIECQNCGAIWRTSAAYASELERL